VFLQLYAQYVRPHLEFASPAWSSWTAADKEGLEKVQIRAVNSISGLKGASYEERLAELGLLSLEQRRNQADLVQTYKILHKVDNVDSGQWFEIFEDNRVTRGQQGKFKLIAGGTRLELRRNFYSHK